MTPGERIVGKFGGINPMARKLTEALGEHVAPSTVQYWKESGRIPAARQPDVLRVARLLDIDVTPGDFFPAEQQAS